MMILRYSWVLALILGAQPAYTQGTDSSGLGGWRYEPLFEYSLSPGADLYYHVRTLAAGQDESIPETFAPAVAEIRTIESFFRDRASWPVVDGAFILVDQPGMYSQALATKLLPPKQHMADGVKRIRVANAASRLAAQLDELAPQWMEHTWPARRQALEATAQRLSLQFSNKLQHELAKELERRIGLPTHDACVTLRLVHQMAGAVSGTLLQSDGVMVCTLSINGLSDATLAEQSLYEFMHALNEQPFFPPSMPQTMLEKLKKSGVPRDLRLAARNELLHLCAASLMRVYVNPDHVDARLETGKSKQRPKLHALESDLWHQYWSHKILRPEFVDALCLALKSDWDEDRL